MIISIAVKVSNNLILHAILSEYFSAAETVWSASWKYSSLRFTISVFS